MWERSAERCSCPASGLEAIVTTNRSDSKSRNGSEISRQILDGDGRGSHEDPAVPWHRRNGRAAPLQDHEPGARARRASSAASRTFVANGAPARPPPARRAPDRGHAGRQRVLEVVARRVLARRGPAPPAARDPRVPASATCGSGGPPRPMATTTGIQAPARGQAGERARDRRLPGALAGADHRERGRGERRALHRRVEPEVRAQVRDARATSVTATSSIRSR